MIVLLFALWEGEEREREVVSILMMLKFTHLDGKDECHASEQRAHDHSYHGDEQGPCRRRSWLATLIAVLHTRKIIQKREP